MKRIKWSLMTAAVVLGIGGAFATRPHYDCTTKTQYYKSENSYMPAGVKSPNNLDKNRTRR